MDKVARLSTLLILTSSLPYNAKNSCTSIGWIPGTPVVILDIPILFEMKMNYLTIPVVVVWVERGLQEARLKKRDSSAIEQARARFDSQLPLDKKRETADYLFDNSGALKDALLQVDQLKIIFAPPTRRELAFSWFAVAAILTTTVATLVLLRLSSLRQ